MPAPARSAPSVFGRPSSSSVTSIGGDTEVPDTATRSGCATLPSANPFASATLIHCGMDRFPQIAIPARPPVPVCSFCSGASAAAVQILAGGFVLVSRELADTENSALAPSP
jgi:hypothetical protein